MVVLWKILMIFSFHTERHLGEMGAKRPGLRNDTSSYAVLQLPCQLR